LKSWLDDEGLIQTAKELLAVADGFVVRLLTCLFVIPTSTLSQLKKEAEDGRSPASSVRQ
jgi:hypothetical protein